MLTALANSEPITGAQQPAVQRLQWFLSESTWQVTAVTQRRIELLGADPVTAPTDDGVLIVDETGDCKDGTQTAHLGRQYLANLGKIERGVVSVSTLWADAHVYYPLEVEPYTPSQHFSQGKADPAFRTKPQIALDLVERAVASGIPFRAVVADAFYGEHAGCLTGMSAVSNRSYRRRGPVSVSQVCHTSHSVQPSAGTRERSGCLAHVRRPEHALLSGVTDDGY